MAKLRPAGLSSPRPVKPPTLNGVSPSMMAMPNALPNAMPNALPNVPSTSHPPDLLTYLEQSAYIPAGQSWHARLVNGQVLDLQGKPLPVDAPFVPGQRIYYYRHVPDEPKVPFVETIVFEDEHLLVADKPHFLPVSPTGRYVQETLLVRLKNRTGLDDLVPIHRIDRDTAGIVMFSKQVASRNAYAAMFRARQAHKVYEAIAPYNPALQFPITRTSRLKTAESFMQMHEVDGAANSSTRIELLEVQGEWARYRLQPITGQRHQLRVHMMALGLPLRGDAIYPVLTPEPALDNLDYSQPLHLLAQSISFDDPLTGASRHFRSNLCLPWP